MYKIDLKAAYFFNFFKICKVQFERPHLQVFMPMFRPGPSTKDSYKTIENPNYYFEKVGAGLVRFFKKTFL